MERELLIQWGMTAFVLASVVAVVTLSIWGILQARRPVKDADLIANPHGYDVIAHASRIAMRRWYRQEDEVA